MASDPVLSRQDLIAKVEQRAALYDADAKEPANAPIAMFFEIEADLFRAIAQALQEDEPQDRPERTTALDLLGHIQCGHTPISRKDFIECDCGTTFWFPDPNHASEASDAALVPRLRELDAKEKP